MTVNDSQPSPMAERIRAYLDDELAAEERAAFEAEVAADPSLQEELSRYERMLTVLNALPKAAPPRSIAAAVECTIRRRSRGRYFALEPRMRLPYETLVVILLFGVLLTSLFSMVPIAETPRFREPGVPTGAPAGTTAAEIQALSAFGAVAAVAGQLEVTVPAVRRAEFEERLPAIGPFVVRDVRELADAPAERLLFVLERSIGPPERQ